MGRKYRQWTIGQMRKEALVRNIVLLSEEYVGVMAKYCFKCHRRSHSTYQMLWSNFFYNGQRCPECKKEKIGNALRVSFEKVKREVEVEGHVLLSASYKNAHTKLRIRCPKAHVFEASRDKFVNGKHRCPICNESKGEKIIAEALDDLDIKFVRQHNVGKTRLKFDFYIPSLRCAIEYDGEHHFKPVPFRGSCGEKAKREFKKTQRRDAMKAQFCREEGIRLVRIPYTEDRVSRAVKQVIKGVKNG